MNNHPGHPRQSADQLAHEHGRMMQE